MLNFNFQVPTRIIFGRDRVDELGKELLKYGRRVLLVYEGSIKQGGL